jgi:methyl-accepting chemotaxis protein
MGETKSNRRKVFLVNPKFQLTMLGVFLGATILSLLAMYLGNNYIFAEFSKKGLEAGLPSDHIYFVFLHNLEYLFSTIYLVATISTVLFFTIIGLVVTHRIAGPIYRLTQHMKKSKNEDKVTKILFRKGDYFPELTDAFNHMIEEKNDSFDKAA